LRDAIRAALDPQEVSVQANLTTFAQDMIRGHERYGAALDAPADLSTLGSLRGIAPDMTGDLDSVEFIRKQRDGAALEPPGDQT
jgi:hypothetical protein